MLQNSLLYKVIAWLMAWRQLSVVILVCLVMLSSMGVSLSSHLTRQNYTRLQKIALFSDNLDSEYEKLLLEQSAWADFARVDLVSRLELGMRPPGSENTVIVKR